MRKTRGLIGVTLSIVILLISFVGKLWQADTTQEIAESGETYQVVSIVDGDTIVVSIDGQNVKIRLIGVDTPESGTEEGSIATQYTKSVLENQSVQLEYDVDLQDDYGRTLAYVYVNGQMINEMLLEEGYASIFTVQPNVKYVDEFLSLQEQARENEIGFWSEN